MESLILSGIDQSRQNTNEIFTKLCRYIPCIYLNKSLKRGIYTDTSLKRGIYTDKFLININEFIHQLRSSLLHYQALPGLSVS